MSTSEPNVNSIRDGTEHEPTGGAALINPADTALLLLDHQSGLFQVVKDILLSRAGEWSLPDSTYLKASQNFTRNIFR